MVVADNREIETNEQAQKTNRVFQRVKQIHSSILMMTQHTDKIKTAQIAVRAQIELPKNLLVSTKPSQTPPLENDILGLSLKADLFSIQPKPSDVGIIKILDKLKQFGAQSASSQANKIAFKELYKDIASITPFTPIPQPKMDSLLANLERFAAPVTTKPTVSNTPSPFSMRLTPTGY